ncbi:MAG: hypothetical protein ACFBSE_06375 [Prochloraceae cyanobacterium]
MKAIALLRKAIRENITLSEIKRNLLRFPCFQSDHHIFCFCRPLKRQSFEFDNIFLEALQKEEKNFFNTNSNLLTSILNSSYSHPLHADPVTTLVNNPRNDSPDCLSRSD